MPACKKLFIGDLKKKKKRKLPSKKKFQKKFEKLPDLILVDGGSGQVHAVLDVLHALRLDIPVAGMVKDKKHRTRVLFYNGKKGGIYAKICVHFN